MIRTLRKDFETHLAEQESAPLSAAEKVLVDLFVDYLDGMKIDHVKAYSQEIRIRQLEQALNELMAQVKVNAEDAIKNLKKIKEQT